MAKKKASTKKPAAAVTAEQTKPAPAVKKEEPAAKAAEPAAKKEAPAAKVAEPAVKKETAGMLGGIPLNRPPMNDRPCKFQFEAENESGHGGAKCRSFL